MLQKPLAQASIWVKPSVHSVNCVIFYCLSLDLEVFDLKVIVEHTGNLAKYSFLNKSELFHRVRAAPGGNGSLRRGEEGQRERDR